MAYIALDTGARGRGDWVSTRRFNQLNIVKHVLLGSTSTLNIFMW